MDTNAQSNRQSGMERERTKRILVIDDDASIRKLLETMLMKEGYEVSSMGAVDRFRVQDFFGYDLILLDIMMPGMDGIVLCRHIAEHIDCPVIFLTAKTQEEDLVEGLQSGAVDYVAKPFRRKELIARVSEGGVREVIMATNPDTEGEAHLRARDLPHERLVRTISGITFDFDARRVFVGKEEINVSRREFDILTLLALHPGKTYTRETIYEAVYDLCSDTMISSVSEYVYQIRKKLIIVSEHRSYTTS